LAISSQGGNKKKNEVTKKVSTNFLSHFQQVFNSFLVLLQ